MIPFFPVSFRFYDKVLSVHEDLTIPVVNPLLAFTLIKRLQSDWRNVVHSLEATENIRGNEEGGEGRGKLPAPDSVVRRETLLSYNEDWQSRQKLPELLSPFKSMELVPLPIGV